MSLRLRPYQFSLFFRALFEQSEFAKDRRNQASLLLSLVPVKSLNGILHMGVPCSGQQQGKAKL